MPGYSVLFDQTATTTPAGGIRLPEDPRISVVADEDVHQVRVRSGSLVLIDGYALDKSPGELAEMVAARDDSSLSRLHGQFSALVIDRDGGIWGTVDRFGARSVYWRDDGFRHLFCSRWEFMPMPGSDWDTAALAESVHHRYLGGTSTIVKGVSRLPHDFRLRFSPGKRRVSLTPVPPRHQQPVVVRPAPHREIVDATCDALTQAMADAAEHYDNVAIFLSGGVDSSLIAALARLHFKRCLLVTPVFPGRDNPELEAAKKFASILKIDHLLVPINENRLEHDLKQLTWQKGSQITFQLLAVQQMLAAVPEEFQLIMSGEFADTLFGSRHFLRAEKSLRRKQSADRLPEILARCLAKLSNDRLRQFLKLRDQRAIDIALRHNGIPYSDTALPLVRDLCRNVAAEDLYLYKQVQGRIPDPRDHFQLRRLLRANGLRVTSANHFHENELAALNHGKRFFTPFMDPRVIETANRLTREQFYGEEFLKPVLRDLACDFYPRELIYTKKHGFEVPYAAWLNGPLQSLVTTARSERRLFDGRALQGLDPDRDYPAFWTVISLQLISDRLAESPIAIPMSLPERREQHYTLPAHAVGQARLV